MMNAEVIVIMTLGKEVARGQNDGGEEAAYLDVGHLLCKSQFLF